MPPRMSREHEHAEEKGKHKRVEWVIRRTADGSVGALPHLLELEL